MRGILIRVTQGYGLIARLCNLTIAWVFCVAASVLAATAQPVTIVALGDSLTAGYGLADPGDGLVPQLQDWLKAHGTDVVIENAGVSGDTTAGGLARLDWALSPGAQAMIVTLGGNDMLRGLPPDEVRANLEAILTGAEARGLPVLLVGMKAPGNFGPDYKAEFDAIYPELAAAHADLLFPDFFAGFVAEGADPADPASYARLMQADGIHPNPDGVKAIVAALGPSVQELVAKIATAP
ncbi:arylesterase [Neotabrizicola sp. sgz301269]|uniref:arylesterase n=1 Tax=Neotabrizicola sp. sgz301269 TaxID=3276282 RepID=UPI003770526E